MSADGWAERMLEAAALEPGDTVLDLGPELGLLTFAAHERIGDGWVIAVDPSPVVLAELLRLAHEAGVNGIVYLVGDADVLPLPDASVDVALARSVLAHGAAASELARVLRPGGRLSLREPLDGPAADELSAELRSVGFDDVRVEGDDGAELYLAARRRER